MNEKDLQHLEMKLKYIGLIMFKLALILTISLILSSLLFGINENILVIIIMILIFYIFAFICGVRKKDIGEIFK